MFLGAEYIKGQNHLTFYSSIPRLDVNGFLHRSINSSLLDLCPTRAHFTFYKSVLKTVFLHLSVGGVPRASICINAGF